MMVAALIMLAMLVAGAAVAGNPASKEAAAEVGGGYKAGRHGY